MHSRLHPRRHPIRDTLRSPLTGLYHFLAGNSFPARTQTESSRLITGSTGSGKSEGELVDLVRIADEGTYAVVLLDGHGPLAFRAAGHWVHHGQEDRLIYEPLRATDRTLTWSMLPRSAATILSDRRIEDAETRDDLTQCLLAPANLTTLADKPWRREWLEAALRLGQAQPQLQTLPALLDAFHVGTVAYERLLADCEDGQVVAKFRAMEQLRRRSLVEYETQTGPARRLLELVCNSEIVRLRCQPGPFDWLTALEQRKLIAFDGGGIRSTEIKRTLFLIASLHVIHAVRRHFAQHQRPLPVVVVLEEAGALGLVTPFVRSAMQELRKAGFVAHVITQSCLDFGDPALFQSLLSYAPWQAWYLALSPADQELGAKVLGNASFDAHEEYYRRTRLLPDGVIPIDTTSRGKSIGPDGQTQRWDRRTGTAFRTRYRTILEPTYKSPQLHEQELRTALATLKVGERLVRDYRGVRRERVRPARTPGTEQQFAAVTRGAIERVRQQPIYQTCPLDSAALASPPLTAAAVLRQRLEQ